MAESVKKKQVRKREEKCTRFDIGLRTVAKD